MGRVDQNKQLKQTNLMETAFRLFTSQGLSKTSISDIAENAGVAKGTFYLYFKDKYDLHEKLVVHKAEQVFRDALEHSGYEQFSNKEDRFLAIVDSILFQMQDNPILLRFLNRNLNWTVFRKVLDNAETGCVALFDELRDAPQAVRKAMEIELYTVIELVGATCYSVILNCEPVSLTEYLPYLHAAIRGILANFRVCK